MKQLKTLFLVTTALILIMAVMPAGASGDRFSASAGPFSFDLPGEWKLLDSRDNGFDIVSQAGSYFFTPAFFDEKIFGEPDHESVKQYVRDFYSSRYETIEKELNGFPLFIFQGIVEKETYRLTGCALFVDNYVMIVYYYEPNGDSETGEESLMDYLSTLRYGNRFVFGDPAQV